jgi:hypothetical protein
VEHITQLTPRRTKWAMVSPLTMDENIGGEEWSGMEGLFDCFVRLMDYDFIGYLLCRLKQIKEQLKYRSARMNLI